MDSKRRRVHVIPHTHYDAEVFLTREETFEIGFRNIELALRLLAEDPAYTFALDQVCYLRPYLQRYPEKREELLRRVREGRLALAGAMHVMPDMNLPGGESLVRQALFGREFFEGELGVDVKCAWTLDSFGYNPQCPQILAKCGYDWNIIQRGTKPGTPTDFLWQGIDGTRFPMTHMPMGYAVLWGAPSNIHEFVKFADTRLDFVSRECAFSPLLAVTGADIAPPDPHLPAMIAAYNEAQGRYELFFSTPEKYFAEIRACGDPPLVSGDLNAIFHGCYSARIAVKQRNRELETALLDMEKTDAILSAVEGAGGEDPARAAALRDAWEPVLFNQFHDIICGSHVDVVYRATMERFAIAAETAKSRTDGNLAVIASAIDSRGEGIPVVVFNSLGHPRSDVVEVQFAPAHDAAPVFEIEVRSSTGERAPCDLLSVERAADGSILRGTALFVARNVPAFGYDVHRILPAGDGRQDAGPGTDIRTSVPHGIRDDLDAGFIENGLVRVGFDLWKGVVTSLMDKRLDWEVADPGARIGNTVVKEPDFGNFWQYNGPCKGDMFHPPMRDGISRGLYPLPAENANGVLFSHQADGDGAIRGGAAFAEFAIDHPFGSGHWSTRVRIHSGLPRIDFLTTLVNNDERVRYRVAFPVSIRGGQITHEIPFGAVERPEGEFPAQCWMDYSEDDRRGVALLNRGLPGNNVSSGVMMLSLLKCTALKEGYGEGGGFKLGAQTDMGYEKGVRHQFRYSLLPHPGDWRTAEVWRAGQELNAPLIAVKTAAHPGRLPRRHSWISVSPSHVVLSSVKTGKRGIVLRVYEAAGKAADVRIDLSFSVDTVRETDLVEKNPRALPSSRGPGLSFPIKGFEIRTFEIASGKEEA